MIHIITTHWKSPKFAQLQLGFFRMFTEAAHRLYCYYGPQDHGPFAEYFYAAPGPANQTPDLHFAVNPTPNRTRSNCMKKLSKSQEAALAALSDEYESATNIGSRAGIENAGGASASLQSLVRLNLAEKKQIGKYGGNRWPMYGYRRKPIQETP